MSWRWLRRGSGLPEPVRGKAFVSVDLTYLGGADKLHSDASSCFSSTAAQRLREVKAAVDPTGRFRSNRPTC